RPVAGGTRPARGGDSVTRRAGAGPKQQGDAPQLAGVAAQSRGAGGAGLISQHRVEAHFFLRSDRFISGQPFHLRSRSVPLTGMPNDSGRALPCRADPVAETETTHVAPLVVPVILERPTPTAQAGGE